MLYRLEYNLFNNFYKKKNVFTEALFSCKYSYIIIYVSYKYYVVNKYKLGIGYPSSCITWYTYLVEPVCV